MKTTTDEVGQLIAVDIIPKMHSFRGVSTLTTAGRVDDVTCACIISLIEASHYCHLTTDIVSPIFERL